ncbi:UNVERIFIED_CONTAM: Gag-Pol polyprotein [Sesamum calycinum]|uniref:Gag-Pol polyprotein n=1 Tax=Sesamum calycinum TaxID=2727403 RepID=A0AAW2JZE0_9LAMI
MALEHSKLKKRNDLADSFMKEYKSNQDMVPTRSQLENTENKLQQIAREPTLLEREKCAFAQQRIKFWGHIIEHGHIRMDLGKVKAIQEWKTPKNVTEFRSFLGLANYYRRFLEGFSRRATPLTALLKKGRDWNWSKECQVAFDDLKQAMISDPEQTCSSGCNEALCFEKGMPQIFAAFRPSLIGHSINPQSIYQSLDCA